jgi:hypothetical protein
LLTVEAAVEFVELEFVELEFDRLFSENCVFGIIVLEADFAFAIARAVPFG